MNFKKVSKKLSQVCDSIRSDGRISEDDEQTLRSLLGDTITIDENDLAKLPTDMKNRNMPVPENDNTPLTSEQKFRLRLMEKTGTGSISIH